MGRVANKIAIVTGGNSPVGVACVKRLADEGAVVVAAGGMPIEGRVIRHDASSEDSWRQVVAETLESHGRIAMAERFKQRIIAKTPLRRLGEPEDAARAAVYLCSDEARHVTGTHLIVDGGRTAGGN